MSRKRGRVDDAVTPHAKVQALGSTTPGVARIAETAVSSSPGRCTPSVERIDELNSESSLVAGHRLTRVIDLVTANGYESDISNGPVNQRELDAYLDVFADMKHTVLNLNLRSFVGVPDLSRTLRPNIDNVVSMSIGRFVDNDRSYVIPDMRHLLHLRTLSIDTRPVRNPEYPQAIDVNLAGLPTNLKKLSIINVHSDFSPLWDMKDIESLTLQEVSNFGVQYLVYDPETELYVTTTVSPHLSTRLRNLSHLTLSNIDDISQFGALWHVPSLRELKMTNIMYFGEDGDWLKLLAGCILLETLHLQNVWIDTLPNIATLTSLTVKGCHNVATVPKLGLLHTLVIEDVLHLNCVPLMPELVTLTLNSCHGLLCIGQCPKLQSLTLNGCGRLQTVDKLHALERLEVVECLSFEHVRECPKLRGLEIRNCPVFTGSDPLAELEYLEVRECKLFNSIQHYPKLQRLVVQDCKALQLTDTTMLRELSVASMRIDRLGMLPYLKWLRLDNDVGIDRGVVNSVQGLETLVVNDYLDEKRLERVLGDLPMDALTRLEWYFDGSVRSWATVLPNLQQLSLQLGDEYPLTHNMHLPTQLRVLELLDTHDPATLQVDHALPQILGELLHLEILSVSNDMEWICQYFDSFPASLTCFKAQFQIGDTDLVNLLRRCPRILRIYAPRISLPHGFENSDGGIKRMTASGESIWDDFVRDRT